MRCNVFVCISLLLSIILSLVSYQVKAEEKSLIESSLPEYNGILIPLTSENMLTREIGGRALDLDVYFGIFGSHQANIYQSSVESVSDYIFAPLLGFQADYNESGEYFLNVAGKAAYRFYTDNDDLNDVEGDLSALFGAKFNDLLQGKADIKMVQGYSPASVLGEGVKVTNQITGGASLTVTPSDLFDIDVGASYLNKTFKEKSDVALTSTDYYGYQAFTKLEYSITPGSQIVVNILAGSLTHDGNQQNNPDFYEGTLGLKYGYLDTLAVSVELGYQDRSYDNRSVFDDTDYSDFILRVVSDYAFAQEWMISFHYEHAPRESEEIGHNYDTYDNVELKLQYQPTERLSGLLKGSYSWVSPSVGDDYIRRRGSVSCRYSLSELMSIAASYKYDQQTFEEGVAEDWTDHYVSLAFNVTL